MPDPQPQTPASPPPATPPAATPPAPAGNATPNLGTPPPAPASAETPNLGAENKPATPPAPAAEIDFKVPEGLDKDGFFEGFKDFAKAEGLTNAQAQKLADRYGQIAASARDAVQAHAKQQVADWGKALQADAELGGAKFSENFAVAQRGLEKVATPELKKFLVESGLGSHPEVVRAFYRMGKAISEDSSAGRRGADAQGAVPTVVQSDEALARQMYPELYNKKE